MGLFVQVAFEFGPDGPALWLVELQIDETGLTERTRFEIPSSEDETFRYETDAVGLVLPGWDSLGRGWDTVYGLLP